jgi:hypothetical protein
MRVRGVQCHSRYAEAFTMQKALMGLYDTASPTGAN